MRNERDKWRGIGWKLALMATAILVINYPAEAAQAMSMVGLKIDPHVIGHGAMALGTVAALPELEFQTKVLGLAETQGKQLVTIGEEVKATKTKQEQILSDVGNVTKETKTLLEDITKLKKTANDQQANHDGFLKKLGDFEKQMRNEVRLAFGDPLKRISANEEMRTRFNCAVRLAVDKDGDMRGRCAPMLKALGIEAKALGEDTSPGSTIIDDALALELYDTLSTFGVWSQFAVRKLTTKQTKYPVKTVRPIANFILTEAAAIADDTNKAGTSVTLEVELIGVLINVSRQLLEDAEIDITSDVGEDFAEAVANRLDVAALTATGAADATNGGMTGVFVGGTLVAAAATEDTVEELDREDFQGALLAVDPIVLNRMAKWWMHPHVLIRALSIVDLDGRSIFQTALEAPAHGSVGSILGYPVSMAFAAPSTNTANTVVATFGDPNGQVVGVRSDYAFESSDHHKWAEFSRSFRATMRAGTKIRRALAFANLRLTT